MAKLFGFEVIINHALTKGDVFFNEKDEVHLSYTDWKILNSGINSSFDVRAKSIYENIANKYGLHLSGKLNPPRRDVTLPDIEILDSEKDYFYLKVCESCSDEKKCKRVPISNMITINYSPEQLYIDTEELEEKTKFVCQFCFNYLKQTGVFE